MRLCPKRLLSSLVEVLCRVPNKRLASAPAAFVPVLNKLCTLLMLE